MTCCPYLTSSNELGRYLSLACQLPKPQNFKHIHEKKKRNLQRIELKRIESKTSNNQKPKTTTVTFTFQAYMYFKAVFFQIHFFLTFLKFIIYSQLARSCFPKVVMKDDCSLFRSISVEIESTSHPNYATISNVTEN